MMKPLPPAPQSLPVSTPERNTDARSMRSARNSRNDSFREALNRVTPHGDDNNRVIDKKPIDKKPIGKQPESETTTPTTLESQTQPTSASTETSASSTQASNSQSPAAEPPAAESCAPEAPVEKTPVPQASFAQTGIAQDSAANINPSTLLGAVTTSALQPNTANTSTITAPNGPVNTTGISVMAASTASTGVSISASSTPPQLETGVDLPTQGEQPTPTVPLQTTDATKTQPATPHVPRSADPSQPETSHVGDIPPALLTNEHAKQATPRASTAAIAAHELHAMQSPSPVTPTNVASTALPASPLQELGKPQHAASLTEQFRMPTAEQTARQIVHVVRPLTHRANGDYDVTLQLKPAELGQVEIAVSMKNGEISMQLNADNPMSRDLLRQSLNELRQALQSTGIATGELDVSSQDARNLAESEIFAPDFSESADNEDEKVFFSGLASAVSEPLSDGSLDVHV